MEETFTQIPNEIIEVLAKTKLSNYEMRYLWILFRKTYGWNKPSDYISPSQFVKETGISKYHIWRTEKRLLWRKIVTKRGNRLAFNSNYGEWKELPKGATVTKTGIKVTNSGKKVTKIGGYKRNYTKETIQKKDFSFKENLKRMEQDINRHIQIIALYWRFKNFVIENKQQYDSLLKRDLRPATRLVGFSNEQILEIMEHLQNENTFKWGLETVLKYVGENLREIKPITK